MTKYLLRLDDSCPTMEKSKWNRIESICSKYNIFPIVGVIPNNKDSELFFCEEDIRFWDKIKDWNDKGWTIALHGYDHVYISNSHGINPLWNRSEFAGVSLDEQKQKIKNGLIIFKNNGIVPSIFFAPSHTFDENTLTALIEESDIRVISDTIAFYPYKRASVYFLPQQMGRFRNMHISGIYTFCYHPNVMTEADLVSFESFIKQFHTKFISYKDVDFSKYRNLSYRDKLLRKTYFFLRKMKGI